MRSLLMSLNLKKLDFTQFLRNSLFSIQKISIRREFIKQLWISIHFSKSLDMIHRNIDFWNRLYLLSFVYGDHPFLSWLTSFKQASFCNKKHAKSFTLLNDGNVICHWIHNWLKKNWRGIVICTSKYAPLREISSRFVSF